MSKDTLFLAFPEKDISGIKRLFSRDVSISWVYLGRDFLDMRRLTRQLGDKFKYIDIAKIHNTVANEIRFEHAGWIDNLNRRYGSEMEWWFGAVSSRNIYESKLFQYSCYLEVFRRLWEDETNAPQLVFAESLSLARALRKWALEDNIKVCIVHESKAVLWNYVHSLRPLILWGKFTLDLVLRYAASRLPYKNKKIKSGKTTGPSIILDTYVHPDSLSAAGVFEDRYYPYLYEYLRKKGYTILVHAVLCGFNYNYFQIYERMRKSETDFIIQEDFLRFSDYICALSYPSRALRRRIEAPLFRGFDLSDIIKDDNSTQFVAVGIQAVLIYRLFIRLGEAGLRPDIVLDWYENQIIDKALIAGARKAFPDAQLTGIQMFIHPSNILNVYPSQSEVEAEVTPSLLLEMSEHQCAIAKTFTKDICCQPVASLRYSHVFADSDKPDSDMQNADAVLVLLPSELAGAVELVEVFKGIAAHIKDSIRVLIKCHRNYSFQELMKICASKSWPVNFSIFHGSLKDALKQASLAVSSGSSSLVEAVARGIPAIVVGKKTALNQNPFLQIELGIIAEAITDTDLVAAINKYLDLSNEERAKNKDMSKKLRRLFFTPLNEENMLPFIRVTK